MLKLNHPNIIKFYGVATLKDPIMIVMEFASGGSLLARVQDTKRPVKSSFKFIFQIFEKFSASTNDCLILYETDSYVTSILIA